MGWGGLRRVFEVNQLHTAVSQTLAGALVAEPVAAALVLPCAAAAAAAGGGAEGAASTAAPLGFVLGVCSFVRRLSCAVMSSSGGGRSSSSSLLLFPAASRTRGGREGVGRGEGGQQTNSSCRGDSIEVGGLCIWPSSQTVRASG